jgi:type II secretion system protein J
MNPAKQPIKNSGPEFRRGHDLRGRRAFTLLELMLAITIFAGVMTAIYATWTAILRSSRVAQNAAAEIQRARIAVQALEQALAGAQMTLFPPNAPYYAFIEELDGPEPVLSFVARLPESYPRGGKFGDLAVRRVTFNLETDVAGRGVLLLRQTPLLFEPDIDEEENPLVLARHVDLFEITFWNPQSGDWEPEWPYTNQLPHLVQFSLGLGAPNRTHLDPAGVVTRVVVVPSGNRPSSGLPVVPPQAPPGGQVPPPGGQAPEGGGGPGSSSAGGPVP